MTSTKQEPAGRLFDVTGVQPRTFEGEIEKVPLEELELAVNPRRNVSAEGIDRLAVMLSRGQLVPAIGRRVAPGRVLLYAGQRRLLAAKRTHDLAGTNGFESINRVACLIVLMLDYEPTEADIRRLQAAENARETLSVTDQQAQFQDAWSDRAGLGEEERVAAVCSDLGISARKAHNLRRQLTLPDSIRARVAERPGGGQISATMANRLADMHDVSPQLTEAVAKRITTAELHDKALGDLGAFVHRTLLEDERTYAVRIDDGALLDGHEQIQRARAHLSPAGQEQLAGILGCQVGKLESELDALAARAKKQALKVRVDGPLRDRARNGRYAYVHERGQDFAAGVWVIDPVFTLDLIATELADHTDGTTAREEAYFAGAKLDDQDLREAAEQERERKAAERARQAEATASNLGLGHDIRAGLMDPTDRQRHALRAIVCHLIAERYREVIAYGAGWTDPERQQPVGDTGRHEPRQIDAIVDGELRRALADPDPLRGIAQLTARWAAAFVLDPDGPTRTKALGTERMARKLRDALPGGDHPLRSAVWEFVRPMLSPRLAELNRDAFVIEDRDQSTVDLAAHRGESSLDELDLGDDQDVDGS